MYFFFIIFLFFAKSFASTDIDVTNVNLSCKDKRTVFDVLDKYDFSSSSWVNQDIQMNYEFGIKSYRFADYTNLTKQASEIFDRNFPREFSFEAVFRNKEDNDYNLFEIFNGEKVFKVNLKTDSYRTTIQITVPRSNNINYIASFKTQENLKKNWHTIKLIVTGEKLILWIDCILLEDNNKSKEHAFADNSFNTVLYGNESQFILGSKGREETSQLELQSIIFRCYYKELETTDCDAYRPQCSQCPSGEKGVKGEKGETGWEGLRGQKGETGRAGWDGLTGLHGDKGVKGESGRKGEPGPKGDRGPLGLGGHKGDIGQKGEPGNVYINCGC